MVDDSLWYDVLETVSVLVLQSRDDDLSPLPSGRLEFEEGGGRRLSPLGQKDDERQGLQGLFKQTLKVADHGVHQLLAERRIGLK